jgi:hypothetical protein
MKHLATEDVHMEWSSDFRGVECTAYSQEDKLGSFIRVSGQLISGTSKKNSTQVEN